PDALRPSFRLVLDQWLMRADDLLGDVNRVITIIAELRQAIANHSITNGLVWEDAAYVACALENRFLIPEESYDIERVRIHRQGARGVAGLLGAEESKYNDPALRSEPFREPVCHMLEYCMRSAEALIGEDPSITPVINDYLVALMETAEGSRES